MLFGTLIHMVRVLQHGMTNLLLVNLNNIVFMNQRLEHVKAFIVLVEEKIRIFIKTKINFLVTVFT